MQVNVGRDIVLDVDVTKLAQPVLDHVVYIGLRNILMDAHAGATRKGGSSDDEARALSEKKLDSLYNGEVRASTGRVSLSPVAVEMLRMATDVVKAHIRKSGKKISDYDVPHLARQYRDKHADELRPVATERVADTKAIAVSADDDILA